MAESTESEGALSSAGEAVGGEQAPLPAPVLTPYLAIGDALAADAGDVQERDA